MAEGVLVKVESPFSLFVLDVAVSYEEPEVPFQNIHPPFILDAEVLVCLVADDVRTVQNHLSAQLRQPAHFHADRVRLRYV